MKPVSDKTINAWLKVPAEDAIKGSTLRRFLRQLQATRAAIRKHKDELAHYVDRNNELYRATLPEGEK